MDTRDVMKMGLILVFLKRRQQQQQQNMPIQMFY